MADDMPFRKPFIPRAVKRAVLSTYGCAAVLTAVAFIPGLNHFYTGKGGLGWLVLPIALPWALARIGLGLRHGGETRQFWLGFAKVSLPAYLVVAWPVSMAAARVLSLTLGYHVADGFFYAMLTMPFSLLFLG
jgi:hypothetical protein